MCYLLCVCVTVAFPSFLLPIYSSFIFLFSLLSHHPPLALSLFPTHFPPSLIPPLSPPSPPTPPPSLHLSLHTPHSTPLPSTFSFQANDALNDVDVYDPTRNRMDAPLNLPYPLASTRLAYFVFQVRGIFESCLYSFFLFCACC